MKTLVATQWLAAWMLWLIVGTALAQECKPGLLACVVDPEVPETPEPTGTPCPYQGGWVTDSGGTVSIIGESVSGTITMPYCELPHTIHDASSSADENYGVVLDADVPITSNCRSFHVHMTFQGCNVLAGRFNNGNGTYGFDIWRRSGTPPPQPTITARSSQPSMVVLEPFYPAKGNLSRAKIEIGYSCVRSLDGEVVVPCFIAIGSGIAREGSGGHFAHLGERPTGHHVPSEGWVNEADGYLRTTYYADQVGGVVDVAIHCSTPDEPCDDGKQSFRIAFQGLQDLGPGVGYTLVGDIQPEHPSNHWGAPGFLSAVRLVAAKFAIDYPNDALGYNDISLEFGGVFDVATLKYAGYDWTPPHQTHRQGTSMDMRVPKGKSRKALALRLFQMAEVNVFQEDAAHWHLTF